MKARQYLDHFFNTLDTVNKALLESYARTYACVSGNSLLEFGGGPSILSVISAASRVKTIHFTDYSVECLEEIEKWLQGKPDVFDWHEFTKYALWCENGRNCEPSEGEVEDRHNLIRSVICQVSRCDAFASEVLPCSPPVQYDVVANSFCLDSITSDETLWMHMNRKLATLVGTNGWYITAALSNADGWKYDHRKQPAVKLSIEDLMALYRDLELEVVNVETVKAEHRDLYDGFIIISGKKTYGQS